MNRSITISMEGDAVDEVVDFVGVLIDRLERIEEQLCEIQAMISKDEEDLI